MRSGRISSVLVVHATRALRDRMPTTPATSDDVSTTALGAWYATRLPWRRPAALLVNHATLLPLLMPLAPAATVLARVPDAIAELLLHHHAPADLIATEQTAMTEVRVAPTADRSTVGVLNEFARLADWHRTDIDDLLDLSLRLATTPLGPLYRRHISPDRELTALINQHQRQPTESRQPPP
jgi:hypothetical protein